MLKEQIECRQHDCAALQREILRGEFYLLTADSVTVMVAMTDRNERLRDRNERLRDRYEDLPLQQQMSNWYDIFSLFGTVMNISVSEIFRSRFDARTLLAVSRDNPTPSLPRNVAERQPPGEHDFIDHSDYFEYRCPEGSDFWFDYAADVGDGFHSTYYVAALLAQPLLQVQERRLSPGQPSTDHAGAVTPLPRGRFLILGGDEVYPSASRDAYEARFVRVYEAAAFQEHPPDRNRAPHLYAVPGNHDWYDGLATFMEVFTESRSIGHWRTQQRASYFAIKLPYKHWIFAIDIGLGGELDDRQVKYFQNLTAAPDIVEDCSSIILCIAEPDWVKARPNVKNLRDGLFYLERKLADVLATTENDGKGKVADNRRGVRVVLRLAGDLHHYRRHESIEPLPPSDELLKQHPHVAVTEHPLRIQNITAGGGGAFLHPTHEIDEERGSIQDSGDVVQHPPGFAEPIQFRCHKESAFPSFEESSALTGKNVEFALRNPKMWLTLGIVYVVLFNLSLFLHALHHKLWILLLFGLVFLLLIKGTKEFALSEASGEVGESKRGRTRSIYHSRSRRQRAARWGQIHGLAQCVVLALLAVLVITSYDWIHSRIHPQSLAAPQQIPTEPPDRFQSFLTLWRDDLSSVLRFGLSVITAAVGSVVSMFVFGLYLLLALNHSKLRLHANGAFASLRIQDYKNFLRIRLSPTGLTVYPIGVRKVPSAWRFQPKTVASSDAQGDAQESTEVVSRSLFKPIPKRTLIDRIFRRQVTTKKSTGPHGWLTQSVPDSEPFLIEPGIQVTRPDLQTEK